MMNEPITDPDCLKLSFLANISVVVSTGGIVAIVVAEIYSRFIMIIANLKTCSLILVKITNSNKDVWKYACQKISRYVEIGKFTMMFTWNSGMVEMVYHAHNSITKSIHGERRQRRFLRYLFVKSNVKFKLIMWIGDMQETCKVMLMK